MRTTASVSQLDPGRRLGKYRILSEIGQGGMGVVYLAEDERLGRQVALKVLPATLTADTTFIERFRKEAKAIASMSHPNVVHLNSFDIIDDIRDFLEYWSLPDAVTAPDSTIDQDFHDPVVVL